jgi:uncharacterized phosphosugar-binding protein
MDPIIQYRNAIVEAIHKIVEKERASIAKAAALLADKIAEDRLIYVIGTGGHSQNAAEELFWRAGGLAPIFPVLEGGFDVIHGALRSNVIERTPGYIGKILKIHGLSAGDVLIVCNAYGINAATIDSALTAHEVGAKVIGVTSTGFAQNVPPGHPSRHPSNKNLYEMADIFINCWMPYGDAVVEIEGCSQRVSPTSTIVLFFALNCLVAQTVQVLVDRGIEPPVWMSANLPGGDEANQRYFERYGHRVKYLK